MKRKKTSKNLKGKPTVSRPKRQKPAKGKPVEPVEFEEMALNKYLAHCGLCSRRKAVEFIEKGWVTVNGEVADKPYMRVKQGDAVVYDGKKLLPETTLRYVLLNKPKNCITSLSDPDGRPTVAELVDGACPERIFPVGRLDRNTTGLLLLTNDGELAKKLSHPSHEIRKLYYATLDKPISEPEIERILAGLELEDGLAPVDACGFVEGGKGLKVGIEIHIGRNRIVRRIFEHLGYQVLKLDRMLYASLTKKGLPVGRWRHLSEEEVIHLKYFK